MSNKMMLPIELTKILYSNWQGEISISSQDSEIYGKCLNGPGKVTFKNGNKYNGNFYNGLLDGKGKFTWANGIIYEGDFTNNRVTGYGIYQWPDGSVYQGNVKDTLRHGKGVYTIEDATYEGQWSEGKKHGKGKIIFKSGSIFEGHFKNDLKDGFGKMYYYPSGNYFEGQWKEDMKDGQGTMNWTDIRQKYVGNWHNNNQHGQGVHIWLQSRGQGKYFRNRYQGLWVQGLRQGFGTFYYANGSKYEGYWKNNQKEGYAFFTNEYGQTQLILFQKDRMIKHQKLILNEDKKITIKKQVQPNYYSLCLNINSYYLPFTPNFQCLYNCLLRNNTQLKTWYKNVAKFYDPQSQYSFCLCLQGFWKIIRSLKILGDISLATINRGLIFHQMNIKKLLQIISKDETTIVHYEDIYYKYQAKSVNSQGQDKTKNNDSIQPFITFNIHDKNRDLLFREFVQLLVWISRIWQPQHVKLQTSIENFIVKLGPFFENIQKSMKSGGVIMSSASDNMSDNKSSISKTEKNIPNSFKNCNINLLNFLKGKQGNQSIGKQDVTITIGQLICYGRISGVLGENQFILLQRILEKYIDNQILNRNKQTNNWNQSALSTKILNLVNYELIQYEFVQVLYILLIKKLPSHKDNEENQNKYKDYIEKIKQCKQKIKKKKNHERRFEDQPMYFQSNKSKEKKKLQIKRQKMQQQKKQRQKKQSEKKRRDLQLKLMKSEDFDVNEVQFDEEEESSFDI